MTGLDEFTKLFGNITVLNVLELALALAFVVFLYQKGKKYILAKAEAEREKDIVFPLAYRYQLCAEGHTGLSPQAFFEQANDMESDGLLDEEELHTGDVVEIDTGLAQFFFYCAGLYDFRPAFFDARRIQTGKQDAADPEVS